MRRSVWVGCGIALVVAVGLYVRLPGREPERKAFGIDKRVPWTTSKVKGSPEPPNPYQLVPAYPKLTFSEPLELVAVPGQKAWLIAERKGKLFTFDADPSTTEKKLVLDVGKTVYGVALHPQFQKNGQLFVVYIVDGDEKPDGTRLARFEVKDRRTMKADPKSEKVLLTWPSGGHNGGCLRFGPDGYLYIVTGDGSGIADSLNTGQDLSDLLASMLRIDVDGEDKGKAYRVPADNPFVGRQDARPEIWAYGLRQAWKFSFDPATGVNWAGEVGQDLWEMVYRIEKGGNYGWSVQEGAHPFRPERQKGPTRILPPVIEHNHAEFRSITGGHVYHGSKHRDLKDAYIYGDYDTGRVWMLRYDEKGKKVTSSRELARTTLRIVAWGQDHDGEVYAVDFIRGAIFHLTAAPPPRDTAKFPTKLSETGVFADTKTLQPAAGLIPYSVNAELWSDGATKERYLAIPGEGKIEYETMTYPQPAPGSVPGWRFPDDTVLVKTFFLETQPGKRRRLETRLLHARRVPGTEEVGDQVWSGYTYIWNDEQTDAELADAKGVDRTYTIKDARGERKQTWHFPSRAECTMCHTVTAKYALGVNTMQLNRDHDYGGVIANQLATLEHIGLFDRKLPEAPAKLPRLVDYRDEKASLDARARSYLHANCSHCHRKWGGGNADFQLLATLPLNETGTIGTRPGQGTFELKDPRILTPGEPDRSLIYHRMTRLGLGRMPHIASNVVDEDAVKLVGRWIAQMSKGDLPDYKPVADWARLPEGITLGNVSAVATDSADRVFLFHRGKKPILVFDRDGKFLRSWGDEHIKMAHGLRIDHEDNVWVTDIGNHQVLKFDPNGKLLLSLGQKGEAGNDDTHFDRPTDIAVTPSGAFYVSDGYGNTRVLKFSAGGKLLKQWGKKGTGPGEFNLPHAICLDSAGRVYVGDRENNRIQVFDAEGKFLSQWKEGGSPFGLFQRGDKLYVADGREHWVKVLDREGKTVGRFGEKGKAPGQFLLPHMLCIDSKGAVYVAEVEGKRLQKFMPRP